MQRSAERTGPKTLRWKTQEFPGSLAKGFQWLLELYDSELGRVLLLTPLLYSGLQDLRTEL